MVAKLRVFLKPPLHHSSIVYKGLRGALSLYLIMPRYASFGSLLFIQSAKHAIMADFGDKNGKIFIRKYWYGYQKNKEIISIARVYLLSVYTWIILVGISKNNLLYSINTTVIKQFIYYTIHRLSSNSLNKYPHSKTWRPNKKPAPYLQWTSKV